MKTKINGRQNTLLIIMSISTMLPITLNATIKEDCKDRLMDVFTKVCGNDRLKRSIEKFDLKKEDYKKFEQVEFIDLSLEEQKKPISFIRHEKRSILAKIANLKEDLMVDVVSDFSQESFQRQRHSPQKSVLVQLDDTMENNDLKFKMTVEELYDFYNNFNDRLPRSFTEAEWKKILRDFVKTCCYEDNICDSENIDALCF